MMHPRLPTPTEKAEENEVTPTGVYLLAFIAGLVFGWLGFKSSFQDFRSLYEMTHFEQAYFHIPGKILQVHIRQDSSGVENQFYPDVLYDFLLDGKSVWGWRLSYEEDPKPRAYWEKRLDPYHIGDSVMVYALKRDPQKITVIETQISPMHRLIIKGVLGLAFLTVGAMLALFALLGILKSNPPKLK